MRRAADVFAPLWLLAAPVAFVLLTMHASTGPAWSSPFGFLPRIAERIPAALALHGAGGGRLGISFIGLLAATAALAGASAAMGATLQRWLGLGRRSGLATLVAPIAGMPLLALTAQGAGLLGIVRPVPAAMAVVLLAGAGFMRWRRAVPGPSIPRPTRGMLALAIAAGTLVALPAAMPEGHPDGLIYHLPVPAWWREAGRITARPDWAFAHLSLHQEVLTFALGSAVPDERWGKAVSLLSAAWVARLILAVTGPVGGWLAAVVAVSVPLLADLAGTGKNDLLFALCAFGALLAVERGAASARRSAWIALGGWLLGGAYAVKNFGVFTAVGLVAALAVAPAVRRRPGAWAALLLPAALVALPQVVRNAITLGSPFYPFALTAFPPVGWTPGRLAMMGEVFNARTFRTVSAPELLVSPALALAHASPFLLALVPVALCSAVAWRSRRTMLVFIGAVFAAWAVLPTGGTVRFLLPLVPPAAVVAVAAGFAPIAGRSRRALVAANLAFALAVHLAAHLAGSAFEAAPLGAWTGRESARAFRQRTAPVGTAAIDWLEADAIGGARTVLVVGQGTQWPRPRGVRLLGREIEQAPWPWTLVRESSDADRLAIRLRQWRVGAVLYNLTAGNFWADDAGRYRWRPRDVAVWRDFWIARARPVRWTGKPEPMEGYLILYRLDGSAGAPVRSSLFLPGTESVFTAPRHRHYDGRPYGESAALLDPYREAFRGIGSFAAREATLALGWDRVLLAAASLRGLSAGLSAGERAILAAFGVTVCDDPGRFPGWLRDRLPPPAIHQSADASYFLNLGLPLAVLPPRD